METKRNSLYNRYFNLSSDICVAPIYRKNIVPNKYGNYHCSLTGFHVLVLFILWMTGWSNYRLRLKVIRMKLINLKLWSIFWMAQWQINSCLHMFLKHLRSKPIDFHTEGRCEAAVHACRSYVRKKEREERSENLFQEKAPFMYLCGPYEFPSYTGL